jgi:hypothetical protein
MAGRDRTWGDLQTPGDGLIFTLQGPFTLPGVSQVSSKGKFFRQ